MALFLEWLEELGSICIEAVMYEFCILTSSHTTFFWMPKISDFGLAKLYPTDNSIVNLTAADWICNSRVDALGQSLTKLILQLWNENAGLE
ncbi:hypothetical protein KY284_010654 [Solanum tuberosum]|nr:hypothetical protein KY284_010654 [Solanum tuberosum]